MADDLQKISDFEKYCDKMGLAMQLHIKPFKSVHFAKTQFSADTFL